MAYTTSNITPEILDWSGREFLGEYQFGYNGERMAFVPQFVVNGKNQIEAAGTSDEFWVRYFLLNEEKNKILAVVTVSPSDVGQKGLTPEAIDILGITNVYDSDLSTERTKYIGYEICSINPNDPNFDPSIDWKYSDSEYDWSGYPVIGEGKLSTPIDISGDREPYNFVINKARPTVSFVGNVEEVDYDGQLHSVTGYELSYANDPDNVFKNTIDNRITSIEFLIDGVPYIPEVTNNNVGTWQSEVTPSQIRLIPGDNLQEDLNTYRNFNPIFKVSRQIKLIIKGDELDSTGIGVPVSASKYYDGTPLCPVVNAPDNATVLYNDGTPEVWTSDPIGITDVGSVYVTVKISISSNPGMEPVPDSYMYYQLQVLPRPIYITSDSKSWGYNGSMNTCDWVTVQGHYDEDTGPDTRIQTRFSPPEGSRKITGIPLIKPGDTLEIEFKGGQTEIGSSSNSFDFEIKADKPNNYDVRVEFGLLKVNLNSDDIYVFIRGNTKGTWYDPNDFDDPATRNYIIWDNSFIPEKDRVCIYNGGIWTVSGWQVVAATSNFVIIQDPFDPHKDITIPAGDDMSGVYGAKNIEFIGKDSSAEVSGVYINNITDPTDENFWHPIEYRSLLSESNFRNINPNFSDNHIHFIVTPNRLMISKRITSIDIAGHSQDYNFNMIMDDNNEYYIPEERTVSGYDAISDVEIYDLADTTYLELEPTPGLKPKSTPTITACCWNENDADGKWYMGLETEIHNGTSDKTGPFTNGFINHNKNFEVSYHIFLDEHDNPLDGYICIHPLDVSVSIMGSNKITIYNGEEQELRGYDYHPEIWWKSDCKFFNYPAIKEAINLDNPDDRWIMEIESEIEVSPYPKTTESPGSYQASDDNTKSGAKAAISDSPVENPDKIIARTNYYRAVHDKGYFEWTDDGYAHGTEINDIDDHTDPDYYTPIPYDFELNIEDFTENEISTFPGTTFHISENFNVSFELIKDGSLTITPYNDEVSVYITGHHDTIPEADGSEHSVSGLDSEANVNIYHADNFDDYISFRDGEDPDNVEIIGVDPGTYLMGLTLDDFVNINKNFINVSFYVTDGWLLITGKAEDFDIVGPDSGYKVFDNTALEITNPEAPNLKLEVQPPSGIWMDVTSQGKIEWYDCGLTYFVIGSTNSQDHKVTELPGKIRIDPLRLTIKSNSKAWPYDENSHSEETVTVHIDNIDVSEENLSAIRTFTDSFTYSGWTDITDPGIVFNTFEIEPIPFNSNVLNKIYVIDGVYYNNGDIIENPTPDIIPCVIITREYGKLEISKVYENVTIRGFQKTMIYDGEKHSLTGYTVDPPLYIPLKTDFVYEDTIDVRDVDKYFMNLTVDSFDWPDNVINKEVEDGWIEITERNLHIFTGSDTKYYDDEEPAPRAENHYLSAVGLAAADTVMVSPGDWPFLDAEGEMPNQVSYDILQDNGDDVKSNYIIDKDWGTLRIYKGNDKKFYRIMGIRKDKSSEDNERKKVHIIGLKGIDYLTKITEEPYPVFGPGNRLVDEDRFYPILHKLISIPEDGVVDFDDVICVLPLFKHSKKIEDVTWLFENKSTGEKIFSKVHDRPIFPDGVYGGRVPGYKNHGGLADTPVLNIIPKELKPGYYDVIVNYKMDHKEYSQKFSSVFMIRKKA